MAAYVSNSMVGSANLHSALLAFGESTQDTRGDPRGASQHLELSNKCACLLKQPLSQFYSIFHFPVLVSPPVAVYSIYLPWPGHSHSDRLITLIYSWIQPQAICFQPCLSPALKGLCHCGVLQRKTFLQSI